MTKEEIMRQIDREKRNIEKCNGKIEGIRAEIAGCRKAISFWKSQLKVKAAKKEGSK